MRGGEQCGAHVPRDWPIYQYDLGVDGHLLLVSCISRSMESWSVYYQLTPENTLKPLLFRFPVLNIAASDSAIEETKIIGFGKQSLLQSSEVLQRRIVSRHAQTEGEYRQYRAEWIWKEGHGITLIAYSFVAYDQDNKPHETILFSQ